MEQKNADQNWSRNGAAGKEGAAIYTRVSTSEQNPDLQLREIQDYADRQDWEIVATYQAPSAAPRPAAQG